MYIQCSQWEAHSYITTTSTSPITTSNIKNVDSNDSDNHEIEYLILHYSSIDLM